MGWFTKKKPQTQSGADLRETFFADTPLSRTAMLASGDAEGPWQYFRTAAQLQRDGNIQEARRQLHWILETAGLESRIYLWAWTALRELGEAPPSEIEREVLGVVIDVGLDLGLDTLAAYQDHSARYINQSGKIIIWDAPTPEMNSYIDALLEAAREIVRHTGLHNGPKPSAPGKDNALITILTPGGIHFGGGEMNTLYADPIGGPALDRGARLMQALISKVQSS
jgi:hypothetical protein